MWEEAVMAELQVLSQNLPGETEQNHKKKKPWLGRRPGPYSNWSPSKYKLEILPLEAAARWLY